MYRGSNFNFFMFVLFFIFLSTSIHTLFFIFHLSHFPFLFLPLLNFPLLYNLHFFFHFPLVFALVMLRTNPQSIALFLPSFFYYFSIFSLLPVFSLLF